MSDSPTIDLARAEHWFGVRPGMRLAEVQAAMQQQGVEAEDYGDGNFTAIADDWEMEFHFTTDGSDRLRQVSIDGEIVQWAGQPVMSQRLDTVLRAMEPIGPAVWEAHDVTGEPFPEPALETPAPVPDENLIEEGTVWLTDRGIGLVVYEGEVTGVAWRAPQDFPSRFAGPLTEAQRQLSLRPDLETFLRDQRMAHITSQIRLDPMRWPKRLLTAATMAALAWIGWVGFHEMQVWNGAPVIQAKLISVETVVMKQFRDYVPPGLRWIIPRSRDVRVDAYRVGFEDPNGGHHEAVMERGELYVPPQNVGDDVPVVYVPGNPERIAGASRARDIAFVQYVPFAIAVGAAYLVLQLALSLIPPILRIAKPHLHKLVPAATVKDPDRPELR